MQFDRSNSPRARLRTHAVPTRRAGFTLIELLIVMGIIAILISILIPAIGKVRVAARSADTSASMSRLSAAMEQYNSDFNSYPGPFRNAQVLGSTPGSVPSITFVNNPDNPGATTTITSTENAFIALVGGLRNNAGALQYDWNTAGQGALSLNPANPRRSVAYLAVEKIDTSLGTKSDTAPGNPQGKWGPNDTPLPELLDRYAQPMPILILRANKGNQGFIESATVGGEYQYDTKQVDAYGFPYNATQYTTDFQANGSLTAGNESYFGNPTLSNGTIKQPQRKDAFILISAGPDGRYGTQDDITNFSK